MRVARLMRLSMFRTITLIASCLALMHAFHLPAEAGGSASVEAVDARRSPTESASLSFDSWIYQLQGYGGDRLRALARSEHDLAVVDLARDAHTDWFRRAEIQDVQRNGKLVLAYFEIGSIERFRPEFRLLQRKAPKLILNRWDEWPQEFFVKYWTDEWWRLVVRPRLKRAIRVGFDGVYLDTPLAYEEIPLTLAGGRDRNDLARQMVDLIMRIDRYSARVDADVWVVPQNSPEVRLFRGYTEAVDGLGVEELFYRATDRPCTPRWCAENLAHVQRLRDAGKFILAVDYTANPKSIESACAQYAVQGFIGYVTDVELDRVRPTCPPPADQPSATLVTR